MLTDINNIPSNSQTPLPPDFFTRGRQDLYDLFSAGLMAKSASTCIPPPQAFVNLAPAGRPLAQTTPNVASPALSSAYVGPSPVPPLASQVAHTQARVQQLLVGDPNALAAAVNQAGGQGNSVAGNYSDAAEVLPMGQTENTVLEQHPVARRRRALPSTSVPGSPWGSPAVSVPEGGCRTASQGLSGWAKLFLFAGAAIVVLAVADGR